MRQKLDFPLCTSLTNSFEVSHSFHFFTETNGQLQTKETEGEMLELDGLDTFSNYSIRVAAFTRAGRGKSSKQIFCKTAEDGKRFAKVVWQKCTLLLVPQLGGSGVARWFLGQTAMMVYIITIYQCTGVACFGTQGGMGQKFIFASICAWHKESERIR